MFSLKFSNRAILLLVLISAALHLTAFERVNICVIDSLSQEPVPYAAIFESTGNGILADKNGKSSIKIQPPGTTLKISMMGYRTAVVDITPSDSSKTVRLIPDGVMLDEVVVKKKKDHYSKRNNKAVALMERVRAKARNTDPMKNDYYSFNKYEKITIAINHFNEKDNQNNTNDQFHFLNNFKDTSEVTGSAILNVSVKEKISDIYSRSKPLTTKEYIRATRRTGIDEFIDQASVQTFLDDVLREIDIYKNDINILQYRFVSPLSNIAADFYKFYITDTIGTGRNKTIELSFVPRVSTTFGFTGKFNIALGDSSYIIKKAVMSVPKDINLNFVDNLHISQIYDLTENGSRTKLLDDMTVELSIVGNNKGLHVRRQTALKDHSFNEPEDAGIFKQNASTITDRNASAKDDNYWTENRQIPIKEKEARIDEMIAQLRARPIYYWGEKILKVLVNGYVTTSLNHSKFDIGPVNTLVSSNSIEGVRLRLGGMTTANLSNRWFARGYLAYGTKDKKFKYNGEVEYSFIDKEYHSREFPVQSLRLSHKYDVDMIGQHYMFTNPDNVFLSLKRMKNNLMTYKRTTELLFTHERYDNLTFSASIKHSRQEATPFIPFKTATGTSHNHYDETTFSIALRYAPGEKFYQMKTYRLAVNFDAPVFTLEHTYGPSKILGNTFGVNRTEASFQKRFWFSAFGYLDCIVRGGHIWSSTPYPSLLMPNANLSYTIQPESFDLMNPMEFISDTYGSMFLTYWANGAIFNYIPLIKRLKMREVFSFKGYLGSLSSRNTPTIDNGLYLFPDGAQATKMNGRPYMELSAGIDNIFKCLRVDYVWRLTYRNTPGVDRNGVRIAFHATF